MFVLPSDVHSSYNWLMVIRCYSWLTAMGSMMLIIGMLVKGLTRFTTSIASCRLLRLSLSLSLSSCLMVTGRLLACYEIRFSCEEYCGKYGWSKCRESGWRPRANIITGMSSTVRAWTCTIILHWAAGRSALIWAYNYCHRTQSCLYIYIYIYINILPHQH